MKRQPALVFSPPKNASSPLPHPRIVKTEKIGSCRLFAKPSFLAGQ
jgi:hypothetical protein